MNELLIDVYGNSCRNPLPHTIIDDIMEQMPKYEYFIKLDVKAFYSSINQDKLLHMLARRIRKQEILYLIEKAIKTTAISHPTSVVLPISIRKIGIPEGLSISNALANIYLRDIDKKYKNKKDISYYRYVDDILILVNEKYFSAIKLDIENDIDNLGLKFNDKKDEGLVTDGFEYLGYKISPSVTTVRQSSILKIEQSIEQLLREIKNNSNIRYIEWKLNLKITGFVLKRNKYGWLFFYSQITDLKLLFHLDLVVKKLVNKYGLMDKISIKRFVRTYAEMHQALHTTKYIPNFDNITVEEKRKILTDIYGKSLIESEEKIEIMFKLIMKREIRDIEKDIQNIS